MWDTKVAVTHDSHNFRKQKYSVDVYQAPEPAKGTHLMPSAAAISNIEQRQEGKSTVFGRKKKENVGIFTICCRICYSPAAKLNKYICNAFNFPQINASLCWLYSRGCLMRVTGWNTATLTNCGHSLCRQQVRVLRYRNPQLSHSAIFSPVQKIHPFYSIFVVFLKKYIEITGAQASKKTIFWAFSLVWLN